MVAENDELIGTLIGGRYRVERKLGEGGMGTVYLAVHEALRKTVALKVLTTAGKVQHESIARFEREAITTANLKHPNIAEATDFGQLPNGGLYIVMEYVEGTTLRSLLAEHGKLPPERAIAILQQVGAALATAHARDVVHRDLKPENVIVSPIPEAAGPASDRVKVIDFGIAKLRSGTFGAGATGLTQAGTFFGTPEYMSPEQVVGQAVDARSDQYALGVLAFELLAGKPPYKNDDVAQLMMMHVGAPVPSTREQTPALPPAVDAVTSKMLAKLPNQRFTSVADAMQALASALSAPPAPAPVVPHQRTLRSPGNDGVAAKTSTRKRRFSVVGAVAATLLLGGIIVAFVARPSGESTASSTELTADLSAALADWRSGNFDRAGAAIASALTASPKLAQLDAVSKPLAEPVADDAAHRALAKLLETTALGRSREMSTALAETALADDRKGRDSALALLRARHDLLSNEHVARVRLRDAETCEALATAKAQALAVGAATTQRDLERLGAGECKTMLRVAPLCDTCAAPAAPAPAASSPAAASPATAAKEPPRTVAAPKMTAVVPMRFTAPTDPGKGKGKGKPKKD